MPDGYEDGLLNEGFQVLISALKLDYLIVDTHPGLNEETLLSIAISDVLIIILRPDEQDYQGTSVTVGVARKLDVPDLMLVVNKAPDVFTLDSARENIEKVYDSPVAAILPHSDEMMKLGSAGIFVARYPEHIVTKGLEEIAARLQD